MRTGRLVVGLNNNQKIRVICNGVGFHTTVKGVFDMVFTDQAIAVANVLGKLGSDQLLPENERPKGLGTTMRVYNHEGKQVTVSVQIDLV